MNASRSKPLPLPCAVLALSVAVCVGSAGSVQATPVRADRDTQQAQREAIGQLLDALHLAARKLSDRLSDHATQADRDAIRPALSLAPIAPASTDASALVLAPLREALLNLPPPVC